MFTFERRDLPWQSLRFSFLRDRRSRRLSSSMMGKRRCGAGHVPLRGARSRVRLCARV
jgi:hypothetical protein